MEIISRYNLMNFRVGLGQSMMLGGNRARNARGFSLVEVLMAVLILGLALLGLGAIIPAVVRQQRFGTDNTFGTLANGSVEGRLRGMSDWTPEFWSAYARAIPLRFEDIDPGTGQDQSRRDSIMRINAGFDAAVDATDDDLVLRVDSAATVPADGRWLIMPIGEERPNFRGADSSGATLFGYIYRRGTDTSLGSETQYPILESGGSPQSTWVRQKLQLGDRLYPPLGSGAASPQFVTDIAVRRVTPMRWDTSVSPARFIERPGNFTLQVALITRRIDQEIRPPSAQAPGGQNWTIYKGLTDETLPTAAQRWPVSEDAAGRASLDGARGGAAREPFYSKPFAASVAFDPLVPDRLTFAEITVAGQSIETVPVPNRGDVRVERTAATAFAQLSVPGQVIVDNLGNVYTVAGPDEREGGNALSIRVTPSVPPNVRATDGAGTSTLSSTGFDGVVFQVIGTAQPVATISIITVNP